MSERYILLIYLYIFLYIYIYLFLSFWYIFISLFINIYLSNPWIYLTLKNLWKRNKSKYKKVGVLPIRIVWSNVLSIGPSSERNTIYHTREKYYIPYYPYWQNTDLFIFWFVSLLCLHSTLRLWKRKMDNKLQTSGFEIRIFLCLLCPRGGCFLRLSKWLLQKTSGRPVLMVIIVILKWCIKKCLI